MWIQSAFKIFAVSFAFSCFHLVKAQEVVRNVDIKIVVGDLKKAESKLSVFLKDMGIIPSQLSIQERTVVAEFRVNPQGFDSTLLVLGSWGNITKELYTTNHKALQTIKELQLQRELLEEEKAQWLKLAQFADSVSKIEDLIFYNEKVLKLNTKIAEIKMQLFELQEKQMFSRVHLTLYEYKPGSREYEFINAPGIELSALFIENPETGFAPSVMHGVTLKYLFNTSKSYGVLGIYKGMESTATVSDMFLLAYGQDFYSKKLGYGLRKFFNPYTSFNLGVYVANGNDFKSRSWFMNPFLGIEIIKTKNFLLETKVGYFLPYKDNRDLRGLLWNLSVNFTL